MALVTAEEQGPRGIPAVSHKVFKVKGTLEADNIDAAFYVLALHFLRLCTDGDRVDVMHLVGDDAGSVSDMEVSPR